MPRHIFSIQNHPKGDIRGLDFDFKTNYLFTANMDDGVIAIFDIGKPGKEKYASSRAMLNGKPKVRNCRWASARQELVSGNQDGTVTFWDARKAEPICNCLVTKLADSFFFLRKDVMHAHQDAITQMHWLEKSQVLMTASKDKKIKVYFNSRMKLIGLLYEIVSSGNCLKSGVINLSSRKKSESTLCKSRLKA